jgi:hypothetical protein
MRIANLVVLGFLYVGCAKYYDWHYDDYMTANIENQSDGTVAVMFCSSDPLVKSEIAQIPADQKVHTSNTYFRSHTVSSYDRRQTDSGTTHMAFSYALLSTNDLTLNKLCVNDEAELTKSILDPNYPNRNTEHYLVIKKSDSCPTDFKDYDQNQSPCQLSF